MEVFITSGAPEWGTAVGIQELTWSSLNY